MGFLNTRSARVGGEGMADLARLRQNVCHTLAEPDTSRPSFALKMEWPPGRGYVPIGGFQSPTGLGFARRANMSHRPRRSSFDEEKESRRHKITIPESIDLLVRILLRSSAADLDRKTITISSYERTLWGRGHGGDDVHLDGDGIIRVDGWEQLVARGPAHRG